MFGFPPLIAEIRWALSSSKWPQLQSCAFACKRRPSTPIRSGFRSKALSYAVTRFFVSFKTEENIRPRPSQAAARSGFSSKARS